MSCYIINEGDIKMIRDNSMKEFGESTPTNANGKAVIDLPRGGKIIQSSAGNIQFGMPPETVKDSLILNLDVPVYYIIPTRMFDKKFCLSVAEFEFPAYFNFFVRKRRIVLICSEENEVAIRKVFTETLSGPHDLTVTLSSNKGS